MSHLAEKIIFIAGHKVTNDPVAIPFSMVVVVVVAYVNDYKVCDYFFFFLYILIFVSLNVSFCY